MSFRENAFFAGCCSRFRFGGRAALGAWTVCLGLRHLTARDVGFRTIDGWRPGCAGRAVKAAQVSGALAPLLSTRATCGSCCLR